VAKQDDDEDNEEVNVYEDEYVPNAMMQDPEESD